MLSRASSVLIVAVACGGGTPGEGVLVVENFQADRGAIAGTIAFADGAEVSGISVSPDPLVPGETVTVRFSVSAPGDMSVGIHPPVAGGRQVALGGPDAPPPALPDDPRSVFAAVDGKAAVSVTLTTPWHPRTAMVTLRRNSAAVRGPRTHDGRAVLALPDVAMTPTHVTAARGDVDVDSALVEDVWRAGPRYPLTRSMDGEPVRLGARREDDEGLPPTLVQFAWDAEHLFVAANLPDRDVRGTYEAHDDPLWKEEAFEVFIFGDAERNKYLELQLSPRGVTFDKRFTAHRIGEESWTSTWTTAVSVDGTVEQKSDRDAGWVLEAGIPWTEICEYTEVSCPPAPQATLRVNVFRLERPRKGDAVALSLSPTRVSDFHAPENSAVLELLP